jgi:LuxR family maltose regulon positive regulatory protein
VARKWRNLVEGSGALRDALRWSVRLTVLLRHSGDEIGARRELQRAVGGANAAGLMQLVFEELDSLGESLAAEIRAGQINTGRSRSSASASPGDGVSPEAAPPPVSIRPAKPVRMPEGHLSPREIEILALVGDGLSNAEIGHRLSLVEGSVKWHLQRIYDKIGTRRRLVAVDRARRMGVFR